MEWADQSPVGRMLGERADLTLVRGAPWLSLKIDLHGFHKSGLILRSITAIAGGAPGGLPRPGTLGALKRRLVYEESEGPTDVPLLGPGVVPADDAPTHQQLEEDPASGSEDQKTRLEPGR